MHSAKREYESGNDEKAVQSLRDIVNENPDDIESQMLLSKILAQKKEHEDEALKIVGRLRQSHPQNTAVQQHAIEILQMCGRHTEASILYDQLHADKKPTGVAQRIVHLNSLAYMRALGNRKLDEASNNIDSAIRQWENLLATKSKIELSIDDAILIAALEQTENGNEVEFLLPLPSPTAGVWGFYKCSTTHLALHILDRFIEKKINDTQIQNLKLKTAATQVLADSLPPQGSRRQKLVELRKKNHRQRESLAMLLTYRALILQKLDCVEQSHLNREYVMGLGYTPEELLKKIPNQKTCLAILAESTAYLDTRGYVRYRNKKTKLAIDDMDIALLGIDSLIRSPRILKGQSAQEKQIRRSREQLNQTLAVLIEHHRLAVEKSDYRRAQFDKRRLKAMGKRPGEDLY